MKMTKNIFEKAFRRNSDDVLLNNLPMDSLRDVFDDTVDIRVTDIEFIRLIREIMNWRYEGDEPHIGIHQSFRGLESLWYDADLAGANTFQVFLRNNRNMKQRKDIAYGLPSFNAQGMEHVNNSFVVHASYVMNPASGDPDKVKRAMEVIREDLILMEQMTGDSYYVLHPGAYTEYDVLECMRTLCRVANWVNTTFRKTVLCLETMAGEGTQLLSSVASWTGVISVCPDIHFCIDTCHIFAAGVSFDDAYKFFEEHRSSIGVIHVNDSMKPFGSCVDRHAGIGHGCIPVAELLSFVQRIRNLRKDVPIILEVPVDTMEESLRILQKEIK